MGREARDPGVWGVEGLLGCQHTISQKFPKNSMKSKKFWSVKGPLTPFNLMLTDTGLSSLLIVYIQNVNGKTVDFHNSLPFLWLLIFR